MLVIPKTYKRFSLKEREKKRILNDFSKTFKVDFEKTFGSKIRFELAKVKTSEFIFINGKPLLAKIRGLFFPTLIFDEAISSLPKILVDTGAISHICNGADVMAPGVVRIDGYFDKNNFILIVDERHRKPLAIGVAQIDSPAIKNLKHGKVVKNIHYVSDNLWNFIKMYI